MSRGKKERIAEKEDLLVAFWNSYWGSTGLGSLYQLEVETVLTHLVFILALHSAINLPT